VDRCHESQHESGGDQRRLWNAVAALCSVGTVGKKLLGRDSRRHFLMRVFIGFVFALVGCETTDTAEHRRAREAWHGPCADSATLLATTSGSPNREACPNKRHRMRFL